ncbi:unnamed protein product (mitochondrion) [Arabidopsis thaliana]|uniref:(thale cress) hypothetical protein n=1 Tax=Arabidopsis thaliana TaxID=3702 RepID=A0A7G2FJR2_ARATH|nr:unnamed protein product [Arabidopsis thaliana]
MFQFAKFSKSKERRLATELGYGFPIGDPWITDALVIISHAINGSEVRLSINIKVKLTPLVLILREGPGAEGRLFDRVVPVLSHLRFRIGWGLNRSFRAKSLSMAFWLGVAMARGSCWAPSVLLASNPLNRIFHKHSGRYSVKEVVGTLLAIPPSEVKVFILPLAQLKSLTPAFGEGGEIRGGRILNTGTKGHPEALEGLEEGDEPHRLSYIRQANTHSSETTSEGALSGTLKVGTICFDWALQADRLTCGDEMESYKNVESRGSACKRLS